ncbi:hypothetical protein C464_00914 [Halorubrum coriense DSM 10284]|uniref:Uncharacterized protein n=1 Tax=Halorubrum coriense DSM 10284 TaxID=1227466 RepID=M0EUI2_9EURY|nr:hypothetical protein C464_00914 [Halorubrum coriense DSM 10284]
MPDHAHGVEPSRTEAEATARSNAATGTEAATGSEVAREAEPVDDGIEARLRAAERAVTGDEARPADVAAGAEATAERLGLVAHLRVETREEAGRDAVRVPSRFVDETTAASRAIRRKKVESAIEDHARRAVASVPDERVPKPVRSVGAGVPVAPVPGYWVATVNAWNVQVRGEYPRFTLRANVGTPDRPFEYVRDPGPVSVDLNGESVTLGSTETVAFETRTIVVVAVPAGPPGVGDVDGTRVETSGGWPCPGPLSSSPGEKSACAGGERSAGREN